jgi:hypothetical protein
VIAGSLGSATGTALATTLLAMLVFLLQLEMVPYGGVRFVEAITILFGPVVGWRLDIAQRVHSAQG